ncbi:hypothetical protein B0H17DRAFT_1210535 [Mycena rosella]|uniref:DUF6534 domain-containing protein n=1 Tax=Mycena rosella TaxID=1033263 RepID=A0AAD7CWJ3_MYCRO|nr:hypothetical protein B0H17DRAFT_1210535 [Mycena rosella]
MAASSASLVSFLDGVLGPVEIGTVVGTFLFKVAQAHDRNNLVFADPSISYFLSDQFTASIVFFSRCSDFTKTYSITITSYGQPPNAFIMNPPASLIGTLVFSGGTDALVQLFYGNRIRVLSGRLHVFLLCIVFAALRFTCDTVLMSKIWTENEGLSIIESKLHWVLIMASTIGPAGDIVIALSMCYYLWKLRREAGHFNRVAGIIQLILVLTRTDFVYVIPDLIQPKLFSNSMLAVLNGRARFRSAEDFEPSIGSGLMFNSARTRERRGVSASSGHAVDIQMSRMPDDSETTMSSKPKTDRSAA